ncbi:hypothetical protein QQY24_26890 [Streptomyces sp. TG1A-8]|uniref:hypothetical protein n=1 Tax=Streptomyces sp. TG1A-8 TaxID=3051385 RepID=UPI00265C6EED|nr:hypothetical protein [Streptomyces sp. TG1A-8]MDO0928865.1 hypothetical protein [Streptomyces sp. TG1A-8]
MSFLLCPPLQRSLAARWAVAALVLTGLVVVPLLARWLPGPGIADRLLAKSDTVVAARTVPPVGGEEIEWP